MLDHLYKFRAIVAGHLHLPMPSARCVMRAERNKEEKAGETNVCEMGC